MRAFEPVAAARGRRGLALVAGGAYLITDGVHGGGAALAELLLRVARRAGGAGGAAAVPAAGALGGVGGAAGGAAGGRTSSAPR